jgi:hypothetical protein
MDKSAPYECCTSDWFMSPKLKNFKNELNVIMSYYARKYSNDHSDCKNYEKHRAFGIIASVLTDELPFELLVHILRQSCRTEFVKWLLLSRKLNEYVNESKCFINDYFANKYESITHLLLGGDKIIQSTLLFGQLHGSLTIYNYNSNHKGNKILETNYVYGKETGHLIAYYSNESVMWECGVRDSKLHGTLYSYLISEPGKKGILQIMWIRKFVDGIMV